MTNEPRHLTGDDLETFYNNHGGRGRFDGLRHELDETGARIDAWDDSWLLKWQEPGVPYDFAVYQHTGNYPLNP